MSAGSLISLSPKQLDFNVELDKELTSELVITNNTNNVICYKVKTTAPDRYQVRPIQSLVQPGATDKCRIVVKRMTVLPNPNNAKEVKHKFLVQAAIYTGDIPDLTEFWKRSDEVAVEDHRINSNLIVTPASAAGASGSNAAGLSLAAAPDAVEGVVSSGNGYLGGSAAGSGGPTAAAGSGAGLGSAAAGGPGGLGAGVQGGLADGYGSSSIGGGGAGVSATIGGVLPGQQGGAAPAGAVNPAAAQELDELRKRLADREADYKGLLAYSIKQNVEVKDLKARLQKTTDDLFAAAAERDQGSTKLRDVSSQLATLQKLDEQRSSETRKKAELEVELGKSWQGKLQLPVQIAIWQLLVVFLIAFWVGTFF